MTLIIAYSVAIVLLLIGSMFFSSADMAYGSISLNRLKRECDKYPNSKKRKTAYKLSEEYDKTISTILLCNDTINAGLDTVATLLGITLAVEVLGIGDPGTQETIGLVASMIVLVFKITFGEIIAKSVGKIANLKMTVAYAPVIQAFYYVTLPITFVVGGFGKGVSYPFIKLLPEEKSQEDELQEMIDEGEEKGTLSEEEADLLRGTVDFATAKAYEVMTPRVKVMAVSKNEPASVILGKKDIFRHSRLPVYENTIDNLLGYVRTKEVISSYLLNKEESIENLIHPIIYFHRSEDVSDILDEMRSKRTRIAAIIDEYGGFEGIVTVEDIIEEIVGEIWDETDHAEEPFVERGEGTYIADGSMNLSELFSELEIPEEEVETDSETLAGFLNEIAIENDSDTKNIEYGGYTFKVLAYGARRVIRKVLIRKIEEEE